MATDIQPDQIINLSNILLGFLIAIVSAVITTKINHYFWRKQFLLEEKSDYRKLYHEKKVRIYEEINNCLGIEGREALKIFREGVTIEEKRTAARNFFTKMSSLITCNSVFVGDKMRIVYLKEIDNISEIMGKIINNNQPPTTADGQKFSDLLYKFEQAMVDELALDTLIPQSNILSKWDDNI